MRFLATAALTFAQTLVAKVARPGDITVDATAGNGHDAVFLARLVGLGGVVHCFDIQPAALAATEALLKRAALAGAARLHGTGHEHLAEVLPAEHRGRVAAVLFNLGFQPGGDETVTTRAETTLAALDASRDVLAGGGVISVVCYTGHPGGEEEARRVGNWCRELDFAAWRAARYELVNKPGSPIIVYCVEKAAQAG
ncbi:tRNA (mnm(5)s(2)U34)-methyltransferase [Desulfovibrio sp. TomC]|uniref:tRNA (mnm(5)s(2)U34)-methyltransferase n=1 Tax=Desulfovibrio sp. TomC TaxID=1562888 RepID=UPI000573F9AA|nr:class I SAM-dependent methyltransferase [Desulfovibrio sp. TomC]KHK01262.1 SAM-dependent methyltransferase [Desulfovibrio sp. TomC]